MLRIIIAIIAGELSLIVLTTIVQEVIFKGISYDNSSNFDLIVGGGLTVFAAVLAGMIMRMIMKNRPGSIPAIVVSIIITIEMTYLMTQQITGDPLWFDILAGLSLIFGIWVGWMLLKRYMEQDTSRKVQETK